MPLQGLPTVPWPANSEMSITTAVDGIGVGAGDGAHTMCTFSSPGVARNVCVYSGAALCPSPAISIHDMPTAGDGIAPVVDHA